MSKWIDRPGIFKARPTAWRLKDGTNSASLAVSIDFEIVAQLGEGNAWDDWSGYEVHTVRGDWYVLKRDGTVNQTSVDQLVASIGWDGNLDLPDLPPECIVQITVKDKGQNGQTFYKATWMNPENFTPQAAEMAPEKVVAAQARFGSLLKAAAASSKAK